MGELKDIYSRITGKIIAELEKGVRPWLKPWRGQETIRICGVPAPERAAGLAAIRKHPGYLPDSHPSRPTDPDGLLVRQVQAEGASSLRAIAAALHDHGVRTPNGKEQRPAAQGQRLLAHAEPVRRLGSPALPPSS